MTFHIHDAPADATLDAESVVFTWTPTTPGLYRLVVEAVSQKTKLTDAERVDVDIAHAEVHQLPLRESPLKSNSLKQPQRTQPPTTNGKELVFDFAMQLDLQPVGNGMHRSFVRAVCLSLRVKVLGGGTAEFIHSMVVAFGQPGGPT